MQNHAAVFFAKKGQNCEKSMKLSGGFVWKATVFCRIGLHYSIPRIGRLVGPISYYYPTKFVIIIIFLVCKL